MAQQPSQSEQRQEAEFDRYAEAYDALCRDSIAISGETREYFAQQRITYLAACLRAMPHDAGMVMDYGCGTGAAAPFLRERLQATQVLGVDPSQRSLDMARKRHGKVARFAALDEYRPCGEVDTAYVSAVFHHIQPADRPAAAKYLFDSLRSGAVLSLWEHNAWSPAARYLMWTCAFDADAQIVWPATARRLLREAGFECLSTRYRFIFPHALRWLRGLEQPMSVVPLGAQYQVLCRKPA
jgi:SAM-dependent methyltransferase